jgi:xanthine dehydrogenase YagS FAD-binding subunit
MKNFEYIQPKTLKEASAALGNSWEEALPYAGGTDLYSLIKNETETPQKIINLKKIPGMTEITEIRGKGIKIGALVKVTDVAENPMIAERLPLLTQAAQQVASPQLRNMATMGGNLCQRPRCWYFRGEFHCLRKGGDMCYAVDGENKYHCIIGGSPCFIVHPSDTAVALLALDARVTISTGIKTETRELKDFFVLPEQNVRRENILKPGEILTEISVPLQPPGTRSAYLKVKERDAWDFAMVSVAAVIRTTGKTIASGKIAYGGVAPKPWTEQKVNDMLLNLTAGKENFSKIARAALADAYPLSDNQYKLFMARNLVRRILTNLTAA